jgi:diguanylate cyclase (GGDEF)-like protein
VGARRRLGQLWAWRAAAVAIVVIGSLVTVSSAVGVASRDTARSQRSFETSAAAVASTLQLAIQHEADLVADAAAFVAGDPRVTTAQLARWLTAAQAAARYPEISGVGEMVIVPAAGLPAYRKRVLADPAADASLNGTFAVEPPGLRPFYCLVPVMDVFSSSLAIPADLDLCTTPIGVFVPVARDSGQSAIFPYLDDNQTVLVVETPVYTGGAAPATVAARRATLIGFIGTIADPTVVLDRALQGHHGDAVTLRHRLGSSVATFSAGRWPAGDQSITTNVGNGWTATVSGPATNAGVLSDSGALVALVAGLLVSILLGLLVYVLATGRARARRLVTQKTDQLQHQALHDALTGLPNRALILDRVEQALARSRRHRTTMAVMFLDLDGFKNINDTFGHPAGDQLLTAVSARLTGLLRDCDTVGRLGGDEFVIVVDGDSSDPEVIAESIRAVLAPPFVLPGPTPRVVHARASIGIAVGVRASADELLRDADVALYEAKGAGKDRYVIFAPEMHTVIEQRLEVETDLRGAVGSDQFFLAYQPVFDLEANTITGVEALLRWQHPSRGLVMPDDFIPLAEDTSLIVPIGRWVLMEACRQAADWQRRGHRLGMSVNVSGRQLASDVDLLSDVRDALESSGLEPGLLTLEITETMLMRDVTASASMLHALKALGVRIAIDDFGTGYSSLGHLQQFPVDALKIDRSFISGLAHNPESSALIHTMIQLGQTLGVETLAEGIEEPTQLLSLLQQHCDSGQGFLLARPLTPAALEELIQNQPLQGRTLMSSEGRK